MTELKKYADSEYDSYKITKAVTEVNVAYFDTKEYTRGRSARVESTLGNAIALTLFLAIF